MEDERDEVFEVVESPGVRQDESTKYLEFFSKNLSQIDLSRRPIYQQVGIGGVTGWCVGSVFKRVGKMAALTIGGGLIMLQLASQSGYMSIHWDKISDDVKRVSRDASDKIEEFTSEEAQAEVAHHLAKGGSFVKKNVGVASGFVGGFLLGLAS